MTETQIGRIYESLSNLERLLGAVANKLDMHIHTEAQLDKVREETCPKATELRCLKTDLDSVAGIVRTHLEGHATEDENRAFYQRAAFKQFIATAGAIVAGVLIAMRVAA